MAAASRTPAASSADPRGIPFALSLAAFGAALIIGIAVIAGAQGGGRVSFVVLMIPVFVGVTLLALRRPVLAMTALLLVIGFQGTIEINTPLPAATLAWFVLLGLIAATLFNHLVLVRSTPMRMWPGIAVMIGYALFAAAYIPFAETLEIGVRGFLAGPAFVFALLAVAYAPWDLSLRWRVLKSMIVVATLVGLYALYRLIVGPSEGEEKLATLSAEIAGELALFGSFTSRVELGSFAAVFAPLLFACVLGAGGRWRLLSIVGFGLMLVALLGSQVRTALIAGVLGILAVLILFQLSKAFVGARQGAAVIAVTGLVFTGGLAYAVTIADSPEQVQRFERILDPGSDYSFQRRVRKWNEAISELNQHPFGQGLGTAGSTQLFHSRIFRLDNFYIDNTYLQIGVQLGYPGLLLFVVGPLLVLWSLAKSALAARDRRLAVLGIGAAGALLGWFFQLMAGNNSESWGAMSLFLLVGLAIGAFVSPAMSRTGGRRGWVHPERATAPAKLSANGARRAQTGRASSAP